MNTIRYLYLRNAKKFPVALVAFIVDREGSKITYGTATFNPKAMEMIPARMFDVSSQKIIPLFRGNKQVFHHRKVPFDRRFLREIAAGRLILDKRSVAFPAEQCKCLHDIIGVMMKSLAKDETLPKRTLRAVHSWLLKDKLITPSKEESRATLQA